MKRRTLWRFAPIVLLSLALIWATTTVVAGPPAQDPGSESSEAGVVSDGAAALPDVSPVAGDAPDEDGYAGPVPLTADPAGESSEPDTGSVSQQYQQPSGPQPDDPGYDGPVALGAKSSSAPSEPESGEPSPSWDQFFTEPQPDEDEYYVSPAEVSANWSNFHYHFVAGTTLRPRDSSTAWDYTGGGCVSAAAGNDLFNIHLDLPDGARIDYLRIFYRDTSAANSRSWITSYDGAGSLDDFITLTYSDNSGYGTKLSAYSGHIVDTYNRAYVLNWVPYQIGSSMRLCGFRVAYRLPD